jgi:methionyl aminopeptidase
MISLKSEKDLQMMRRAGKILAKIMQELQGRITAGISTREIDCMAGDLMKGEKVESAFKGYRGFPGQVCASVNEEVVHGIPGERRIREGDIISLDLGIKYEGYFSDAAITLPIGEINPRAKKLIEVTKRSLSEGVKQARMNNHLSDISYAIQNYTESQGFSVVRQFVGHGIGTDLHEEPEIPNFGRPGQGPRLKSGMVLAIEPMINMGGWECETLDDGWTVVTKDRLPSAHFEHTVAITPSGPEILTAN